MISVKKIRELAETGKSDSEIADFLKCTRSYVTRLRNANKIPPGGKIGRKRSKYKLFHRGLLVFIGDSNDCAKLAGISERGVRLLAEKGNESRNFFRAEKID